MVARHEITASAGRLRSRLEMLQGHQRSVWFGEGMGLLVAVLLPALGVAMVVDNFVQLPFVLRCLWLVGVIGAAVLVVRWMGRLLREPLTAERMAVKVEQSFPQIDNRFINSLLLAHEDNPDASELIHSVIEQGNADAASTNLHAAIPKRRLRTLAAAAAVAFGLMAFYAVAYPNHFVNALARVLFPFAGVDPLTRTQILAVTPKDKDILVGDDVAITADVTGKLPDTAELVYEVETDEKQVLLMQPVNTGTGSVSQSGDGASPPQYRCVMSGVPRSFTYRVAANDARSPSYRITVHERPVISAMDVTIAPPSYTGDGPITRKSGTIHALPGSTITLRALCSQTIRTATLVLSTGPKPLAMAIEGGKTVVGSFPVPKEKGSGTYRIELTDTFGFQNKPVDQSIELLDDEPPEIKLEAPPPAVVVKPEATVPFQFLVTDQYGVQNAEIVRVTKDQDGKEADTGVKRWDVDTKKQKSLSVKYELPAASLGLKAGQSGTLQVVARDWNDVTGPGVTRSSRVVVTILSPEEAKSKSREAIQKAAADLVQIILKQRQNLLLSKTLHSLLLTNGNAVVQERERFADVVTRQEEVRAASGKVIELMKEAEGTLGAIPMRGVLEVLYENEMVSAVQQLRKVAAPGAGDKPLETLTAAIGTERVILTRLTGRADQLRVSLENAALRDVFALLDELQREQKKIRNQTETLAQAAQPNQPLAKDQDKLAPKVVALKELLSEQGRLAVQSDAQQSKRFDDAAGMVDSRKIRPNMLLSAAKLGEGKLAPALPVQDTILADLKAIGDFLRAPIAASAAEKLKELQELISDAKEKTDRLAKLQAAVKEVSEEMERSKDTRSDKGKELAQKAQDLQDTRDKIEDSIEKLAKDLALFPEVPACNELVQQVTEVFEDVKQAAGSEKKKEADEIAVDRDEGMLDALGKTKERMADMEKWLMDKPDDVVWKQEAWDKNEMPKIPMVDLPEKLEDLVGDLVEKEKELDDNAQDTTSNAATADIPAGWDVADGPISNWSAKGASGNEKPNANEMAGRSGAGREGQADGEMVEGKAKDLEGREPETRRTRDPFGDGQIEEEEGSKAKAKATGGGKQSGTGGEGGMQGSAPARNELQMRDMERRQRNLRRNTESVYSRASLMYLPTGELDKAVLLMAKAEEQAKSGDYSGFSETQKRIVHALQNTQRQLNGQGAVAMDRRQRLPGDMKEEMYNARDEPIPPEYERLVGEYYKAVAIGASK